MSADPHSIVYHPQELLKKFDPENKLERYYQLLLQENKKTNLVSRETGNAGSIELRKLAAQSLIPFEKIDVNKIEHYLDIGSGGGFPAIPILLTREVRQATLVERTQKKAGALRRIILALGLNADIIGQTFEELSLEPVYDLITLRQVKLTARLFRRIVSVLQPDGVFIYFGTPDRTLSGPDMKMLTYRYSTGSGDPGISVTICRKR